MSEGISMCAPQGKWFAMVRSSTDDPEGYYPHRVALWVQIGGYVIPYVAEPGHGHLCDANELGSVVGVCDEAETRDPNWVDIARADYRRECDAEHRASIPEDVSELANTLLKPGWEALLAIANRGPVNPMNAHSLHEMDCAEPVMGGYRLTPLGKKVLEFHEREIAK